MTHSSTSEPTDAQLLEQYVSSRSQSAFELLVKRHGQMVLAACRRILGTVPDAEDAFQATFIILSTRAARISPPDQVGKWLYGVAVRTALRARSDRARRTGRETNVADFSEAELPEKHDVYLDLVPLLDEEIAKLPPKYGDVILLCDLQELSHTEAARLLGLTPTNISVRLTRGRRILSERLRRRCRISFAITGLIATLQATAQSDLSHDLIASTTRTAAGSTIGSSLFSTSITQSEPMKLAQGVLQSMARTTLLKSTSLVLTIVLASVGVLWTFPRLLIAQPHGGKQKTATKLDSEALEAMQGKWILSALESKGENVPLENVSSELKIESDGLVLTTTKDGEPRTTTGRLVLDTSAKPWKLDWIMDQAGQSGGYAGSILRGIVSIEEESLKFCHRESRPESNDTVRPEEFRTRRDIKNLELLTFSRRPPQQPEKALASPEDLKPLQGSWSLIGMELAGRASTPDDLQKRNGRLLVESDRFTLTMNRSDGSAGESMTGVLLIDSAKKPMKMTWTGVKSSKDPTRSVPDYVGIYKLVNDEIHFSFVPRDPRSTAIPPADFKSKPDTRTGIMIFKRTSHKPSGTPTPDKT